MILVAYRHGLRVSELVDLRWDQIDFTTATMHVRRVKEGTPSTHPILGDESRALRRQSGAWTDLSLAIRKQRENIMRPVISSVCDQPLSRVDKAAIQLGRERRAATPTQAKHLVTTMRACSLGHSANRTTGAQRPRARHRLQALAQREKVRRIPGADG